MFLGLKMKNVGSKKLRFQNTGNKKQLTEILFFTKGKVRTLKCCIVLQNTGLKHSATGISVVTKY
jgi:hypothetical protein